jgi:enhancer of mRNA-decapping protein 3
MANQFLGDRMKVVLKEPPCSIEGTVYNIVPMQTLSLRDVLLENGQIIPDVTILASNVVDLQEMPRASQSQRTRHSPPKSAPNLFPANDPAIVSLGRRPPQQLLKPVETHDVKPPHEHSQAMTRDFDGLHLKENEYKAKVPSPELAMVETTEEEAFEGRQTVPKELPQTKGKKARRRTRNARNGSRRNDGEVTPTSNMGPAEQGDGWRQTPILQSTESFQPYTYLKRGKKGRNAQDNGWASEDVTDVQGAGDFDFVGSTAKFDKRTIFDQMRQQDQTDDADRLVSHNRLPRPKPGTAGGKNLHYSENVLDTPAVAPKLKETPDDFWKSEADDATVNGEHVLSGRDGSGRTSRLRAESRVSTSRRSQSRKTSTTQASIGPARVNSGVRLLVPAPHPSPSKMAQSHGSSGSGDSFYVLNTDRRIETITHLQMLNLENIAHNEVGLTEELMAEHAGRSISEVALTALTDPAIELRNSTTSPPNPETIVVLAGNHKSGTRAVSAARHLLRRKGTNLLVCIVGIERERDLIEELRKQIRLFRNFGGRVISKTELFEQLSKAAATLDSSAQIPVTLILDALIGLSISFEELRKSDQATTYELMEWANRNEAFVMAIDIPSGIDPSSGKVNIIDGTKLYVHPRYVCALGAPKLGLLKTMCDHEDSDVDQWKLYLADIGLGSVIWRKAAGTKLRRGIDFDGWVMEMRFQPRED